MADIFNHLKARPYPGRGILLGRGRDGDIICAYFIMGRSENSRNRVFEHTQDGIRTRAFDEAKMTDPSLIIYHPVRRLHDTLIVTNGDQTDTIREFLADGKSLYEALATRRFEPDAPNYTPRISGVAFPCGCCSLSILKAATPESCDRFYYTYNPEPGEVRFISTYAGAGEPLPSFSGEPLRFSLPQIGASELAEQLWDAMDVDNRVSLYVEAGGDHVIINKNI
ncbi:MAG: IMP cyclohydrolase [Oscillospiraceae bacterium]